MTLSTRCPVCGCEPIPPTREADGWDFVGSKCGTRWRVDQADLAMGGVPDADQYEPVYPPGAPFNADMAAECLTESELEEFDREGGQS